MGLGIAKCSAPCSQDDLSFDDRVSWKRYFIKECKDLREQCGWALSIEPIADRLQSKPLQLHIQEVNDLNQIYIQNYNHNTSYVNSFNNHIILFSDIKPQPEVNEEVKLEDETESILNRLTFSKNARSSGSNSRYTISSQIYMDNINFQKEKNQQGRGSKDDVVLQLNHFSQLTQIIKIQLSEHQNQLCKLILAFISSFEQLKDPSSISSKKLFQEVQQFSRVLWQTAIIYYGLNSQNQNSLSSFFINEDNLLAFFVSLIVNKEQVHRILFENLMFWMNEEVQPNMKRMAIFSDVTTPECDIGQEFRLDISTFYYLKHKYPAIVTQEYKVIRPFKDSINELRKITQKRSSCSKIKCILKVQQSILKSITNFYKSYDVEFDGTIDSDALISIQLYIIMKAQVLDLEIHLKMIERLATNKVINGQSGYYITSLQVACSFLEKFEKLKKSVLE